MLISHVLHRIWMASSEGRVAAFFIEGVSSSAEGELAIDETASMVSVVPNVCVVPGVSAAVEEGEECVGEFASPVSGGESAERHLEGEVDDNDSFVDIMSCITAVGGADNRACIKQRLCWTGGCSNRRELLGL